MSRLKLVQFCWSLLCQLPLYTCNRDTGGMFDGGMRSTECHFLEKSDYLCQRYRDKRIIFKVDADATTAMSVENHTKITIFPHPVYLTPR